MSLFLIGARGAGKSTAGAAAAARLGVPFVDADRALEELAGRSIAELFASAGEAAFRVQERALLLELLPRPGQLVATGGGAVLEPDVREALRRHGHVLWLDAPPAVLAARVRATPRPSLTGADPADELPAVCAAREPLYRACADERLDTHALSLDEVVHVIEQLWPAAARHDLR